MLHNNYLYPSCKPSCVPNGETIVDAMYRLEATNECWRVIYKKPESILASPVGEAMKSVNCATTKTCGSDDKFILKADTPSLEWKFEVSELPATKTKLFDHLELGPNSIP